MTLGLPIALSTVATVAAICAGLAVAAYILRMRRRRFEVPFSSLWHRVLREKETTSLWRRLRRLLSLLLQLAILALILGAVLDPRLGGADKKARSVVIIIDASASMKARDEGDAGDRPRIEAARAAAMNLLDAFGGGDSAMIVRMDGQTTPLSRFDSDVPLLRRVVAGIEASDTPADLRRALSAASDALRERQNPMIVLIGDGTYPQEVLGSVVWERPAPAAAGESGDGDGEALGLADIDLSGIDVHFIPVGRTGENVGIVAFNVRRYLANKTAYEVFIEVQNFGSQPAQRRVVLYSGDLAVDVQTIELGPGEKLRRIYPEISGGEHHRLRAVIEPPGGGNDVFALDDEAHALLPARKRQKVLLVTADNLYLEGAMLVYENIQIDKLTGDEYEAALAGGELPAYDAVVYDDYTPGEEHLPPPETHLLYFNPQGPDSPMAIARTMRAPRITEVDDSHPVMRWVVLSDVNFDQTSLFRLDRARGEVALARSVREPVIAARRDGPRKIVAAGFSLGGTDLMMRVAFPLLLVNTLDWFAGDDADLITTYATGQRFRVPMDGVYGIREARVRTPSGTLTRAPMVEGQATFYGNFIGVHTLTAEQDGQVVAEIELAANLANPTESDIAPAPELSLGGVTLTEPAGFRVSRSQAIWLYMVLAALLLLCAEWLTYNRRITV